MSYLIRSSSPPRHRHHAESTISSSSSRSGQRSSKEPEKQYYYTRNGETGQVRSRSHTSSSSRSFFSMPGFGFSASSSSSSRARPRTRYVKRIMTQIRRHLRRLYDYARRNPVKLIMLLVMPLVTGGALAQILARLGIRIPPAIAALVPGAMRAGRASGFGGYGAGARTGYSSGQGMESVFNIAKMFI